MMKHLFRYLILLILALAVLSFTWLTMSTSGLKTALYILQKVTPGELNISGVSGSFSQGIKLTQLTYDAPETKIQLENLQLQTQPLALFRGELQITNLQVQRLKISSMPTATKTTPPTHLYWYLPLHVALQNVNVKKIILQHDKQTTVIDDFLLQAFLISNHLELTQLQLTYNQLIYHLEGDLGVQPIIGALHFSVRDLQKQPKFSISISGNGNWQQLALKGEITTPLTATFNSQISNMLENPQWDLKAIIQNFNPHTLLENIDDAPYEGVVNAHGTMQQLLLDAKLTPQFNQKHDSEQQAIKLQIMSSDLQNLLFKAHLQWNNFDWPLRGTPQYSSGFGDIQLSGTPRAYTYTADISLQGDNIPVSDLKFSGVGNQAQIQLTHFKLLTLGGKISGQGFFQWQTPLNYQLQLTAANLDPEHQWADWEGNLNFAVNVQGNANNLALQFSELSGKLRQQAVDGKLALTIMHKKLVDIDAFIHYGKATLVINAERQPALSVKWNVTIPDLAKLTPFGNGTLNTQGEISQLTTNPKIKGYIDGSNLAWLNYQASKLTANFDLDANLAHTSNLIINSDNLKFNQLLFQTLTINLNGNPKKFTVYAGSVVNENVITLSAYGQYVANQWYTTFQQLDWKTPKNIRWALEKPFAFNFDNHQLKIEDFIWHANEQSMHLNLNWHFDKLPTGQFSMINVSLDNFDQFLTNNLAMEGRLNLQFTNQDDTKNAVLNISASSEQAKLFYYNDSQDTTKHSVSINSFTAQLQATTKALTSHLNMQINDGDYLRLNFNLPNYDIRHPLTLQQTISGDLAIKFSKLDFLAFILPNLSNTSGQLLANLKWEGTLAAPHPVGELQLRNGAANITTANLNLTRINFNLDANAENQIQYQLQMNSGDGSLLVKGTTDYWREHYPTTLKISGRNFLFVNTHNYKIVASPNLTLTQHEQRFDLDGSIAIPEAIINYGATSDVVALPSDVVVNTDINANEHDTLWNNFYANVQLILGEPSAGKYIKISVDNLIAELTGRLTLKDSPKTPTLGTGELTITNGTYTAFGQTLTISNGKLMFSGGPVENPGLLIKATKSIRTYVNPFANALNSSSSTSVVSITPQEKIIVVGISVTNNLNDPILTLFSDQPNLTKTDILSYLVLGYPLSQANPSQEQTLVQAASALNLGDGQSSAILKDLKDSFSLDQVGLQSSNYLNRSNNSVQQNTSLLLGKMLSPRLFVSYSIGLLAPINTVTASYALTQNLSTQTSSSSLGSGIDLIYSFEHN